MHLSTRTRYGSRAMVELAEAFSGGPISTRKIAERLDLSPKYLEQILSALKAAGLVKAVRGIRGGYALARQPTSIKLSEVFRALEGSPILVECVEHPEECPEEKSCPTRETWVEMQEALESILENTTLDVLLERKKQKSNSVTPMYNI